MKQAAFAGATFLGAFLLFQVQPLIGKFILPWFGGATSVWTTCLLFFQFVLLAGYAYAHAITRIERPRIQAIVHLLVVAGALAFLPIAPKDTWKPIGPGDPTWRILGLLTACLGAPYFVLSATSPLLQAWFFRSQAAAAPYRLYALSNIGSLAALISFPFVFEPLFSRKMLSNLWSVAFVVFGALMAVCAFMPARKAEVTEQPDGVGKVRWPLWILLPAAASTLLLATTNKICQDVAVVPFLWVLPLALYLVSFVVAFDSPRWYRRDVYVIALAICTAAVCVVLFKAPHPPLALQLSAYCGLLFVYCMVCHGEVYRMKPHPSQLTAFYLCISLGGALGGMFVGLLAPLVFNNYFELHIAMLILPLLIAFILQREGYEHFWKLTALGTVILGAALAEHAGRLSKDVVARTRNFYGVLRVFDYNPNHPGIHFRRMNSGDISHGEQFMAADKGMMPTTYYVESSGVGLALRAMPAGTRRIGAIGLGVGTLAAYAHAGDTFRFYEINPEAKRLAETHFTYLLRATGAVEVVLGDARLSLERERPQNYDLLVLDAFSGDSIPVHLLTREALDVYLRHLKPAGVLAVHVTNRHLDLVPVVQKLAEHHRLKSAYIRYSPEEFHRDYESVWMLLSREAAFLDQELIWSAATPLPPSKRRARLWTDDYASLLPLVKYESR
jgi:hypothetical protein